MKLSSQNLAQLKNIFSACSVGSIESIILDGAKVRGLNEDRTFAILSDVDVPELPQKMGIGSINSLRQVMELFSSNDKAEITAKESDRGEISSIEISAGRTKGQFRCTSTVLIKAPTSINDVDAFGLSITKEEAKFIINATRVSGTKTVQVVIKKDGDVSFIVNDVSNDALSITLESPVHRYVDSDSVVFYYHSAVIVSLLKEIIGYADDVGLIIGESGSAKTVVHGHTVYLLPKVEDTE